ncbi:hypothetical protein BJ138DRAFT_1166075 [Hygrophoropsis aurantiaca]|uniref:Uncharacterized protein n=1 Tax=Hygrophoropsis aurantiaca TaxID=72124 RepID=A0ACB7ZU90_9AGAM|nr:hypothetical protein BJ138DRAFT_1166075 [Hygrophoropsis aurantiaca]
MSPTSLIDLPDETLLDIIDYQRDKKPVALACKRLNSICSHWFFRTYHLRLRVNSWDYSKYAKPVLALDTNETLQKWDNDAVHARLAHLREKAPHVRELVVYNAAEKGVDLFPEDIVPELMRMLEACTRITAVRFNVDVLDRLPVCFWNWFATIGVLKVDLGRLAAPQPSGQLKRLDSITSYEGCLYDEARPFLEFINPTEIKLNYLEYDTPTPMTRISLFKPLAAHFHRLTTLKIELDYRRGWKHALFDFADIPQASVNMTVYLCVEYKMHIPAIWLSFKKELPTLFVEDLGGFDVRRERGSKTVAIYRPPAQHITSTGWVPKHADHKENAAEEKAEAEAMGRYYEAKMRREFERMHGSSRRR